MASHGTRCAVPALAAVAAALLLAAPARAQSKCDKLRFLAAGNAARLAAACAASAAAEGTPVDPACLEVAADRLQRKWERASTRGDCVAVVPGARVQVVVDDFFAALVDVVQPPSGCCDTATNCFAGPSITPGNCQGELLGTPGPPGSVCDGATGTCVPAPGAGGPCCQLDDLGVCATTPGGDLSACESAGGTLVPSAVCETSGACVAR